MRKNKSYSKELKLEDVRRYKCGESATNIIKDLDISGIKRIYLWTKQYDEGNITFKETRSINSRGRPKKSKFDTSKMTKDEYIKHLEMENDILKSLAEMKQE